MRVSTMTVYRLIRAGALPAIRVGKHFRIRTRDLEGYLEAQEPSRRRRMARRLIGLDIGTNAVTDRRGAAPGTPPRLDMFAPGRARRARRCAKARSPTTPRSPTPSAGCATRSA